MKSLKAVLGVLCFILPFSFAIWQTNVNAVINGSDYAQQYREIVFPQITSADTLESVRILPAHEEITFFIKVLSTKFAGMSGDTVYVRCESSADDSSYVNVSAVNETKTYTSASTSTITFDYLKSARFMRLAIPRMSDSLKLQVKAVVAPLQQR